MTPNTGTVVSVEYHKNGQLKEKYLQRWQTRCPYEAYHESGKLMGRGTYKDGKSVGAFETYYGNGQLWFKILYEDGEKFSSEMYYEDGRKVIF